MACAPNSPISWSDVYAIATRIDSLAETLNTPGYTRLRDEIDMPFKFADLVNFSGAIRFGVNAGTINVTQQHLSGGVTTTAPYNLDPVLEEMGRNQDLFLVVEEDDCWCKTIFEIDTSPGVPRVKEVSDLGCCQSLFVPQPGDSLNYSQHIIPAGGAQQYAAGGNPEDGALWQIRPACTAETVESGFKFQTTAHEAPLTDCTREIRTAKFTWPMRASYMSKMVEKIKYILECDNSGGAKADSIQTASGDYFPESCEVTLCVLVVDRVTRGLMDYSTPGCVSQGCNFSSNEPTAYPWNSPTCGGENCASKGPKYYCRTLEDLEAILSAAENGVRPRNAPSEVCQPCNCSWGLECESRTGTAESCYIYAGSSGEALIGFRDEIIYDEPACTNFYQYAYVDGIQTYCNGSVIDNPCGTVLVGQGKDCEGIIIGSATIPIFGPGPSWESLKDAADLAWEACTLGGGECAAYASTFYAMPTMPTFPPAPAAWAEKSSMRFRFRMGGEWSCGGAQDPSRTVRYRRIESINGEVTETTASIAASWDPVEKTYVSTWLTEAAPAWPGTNPGSNSVVYSIISASPVCPQGCTPIL